MTKDLRVQAGTLLAAWPDLMDPNFMHSVILICDHTDEGAYGLVTNRRSEFSLGELLGEDERLKESDFPVYLGGPVDRTRLQFVHIAPDRVSGGMSIDGRIWLGGDLDDIGRFLAEDREKALRSVRIFLGYSGWGGGQLEGELTSGSWLPAPPAMDAIFGEDGVASWRQVVRSVAADAHGLEEQPPDVSWN